MPEYKVARNLDSAFNGIKYNKLRIAREAADAKGSDFNVYKLVVLNTGAKRWERM